MSARYKLVGSAALLIGVLLVLCICGAYIIFLQTVLPYAGRRITENIGAITAVYFVSSGLLALVLLGIGFVSMTALNIKNYAKPLRKLKIAAAEIRDGNLDYELVVTGNDEFSEVGRAFEQMRISLKDQTSLKNIAESERRGMMAGICHDLNTPITSIVGYAEGLLDGVAKGADKTKEYVSVILNKALSLKRLTEDLSLLSNLENAQITLEPVPLDAGAFSRDIAFGFADLSEGFELSADITEGLICNIDKGKFTRVLENILQNNVKYKKTEQKGPIVHLSVSKAEGDALITVSDQGLGIPQEETGRVYDRFYRADTSRGVVKGSGLGLSIVKQIVMLHGGKTWVTRPAGGGFAVNILLPLSENGGLS